MRSPRHLAPHALALAASAACMLPYMSALAQEAPAATGSSDAPGPAASPASNSSGEGENAGTGAGVVVDDSDDEREGYGLLGPVRLGAMVAVGVPDVLHYSLESRFYRIVGLGLGFGGFTARAGSVEVGAKHFDARLRWFPFSGSFFLGTGLGTSKYETSIERDVPIKIQNLERNVPVDFSAEIDRTNLTPLLGWQWIFGPGFTMGLDFGWQFAVSSKGKVSIDTNGLSAPEREAIEQQQEYKDAKKKVDDVFDGYKGTSLPHASLGLGWLL